MIVVLLSILPLGLLSAEQTAQSVGQVDQESTYNNRLFAVGAGAIVGIVAFNMLTAHIGSVPFVAAPLDPTPKDIALGSRVLATLVAGAGALVAHYLYEPEGDSQ
jgi:hypothetical protein